MSLSRPGYCAPKGAWVCLLRGFYKYKYLAPNGAKTVGSAHCLLLTAVPPSRSGLRPSVGRVNFGPLPTEPVTRGERKAKTENQKT